MHVIASAKEKIMLYYGKQKLNGKEYYHTGIDMVKAGNMLDKVIACETGKVKKVVSNVKGRDLNKGYGNYIEIEHGGGIITRYCHLKYNSIKVKSGRIVKKGEIIAAMGDTGYTFGAHLHFEIVINGKTVNPLPYLKDEKKILAYNQSNEYMVIVNVLTVRKGASTSYDFVRYNNLTKNAKVQMKKYTKGKINGYVKNMIFTALDIKNENNNTWAKTPSGWVCIKENNSVYCKKV